MTKDFESPMFPLMVDYDTHLVINAMLNACNSDARFMRYLNSQKKYECFDAMTDAFAREVHVRGWCKDPNCTYGQDEDVGELE